MTGYEVTAPQYQTVSELRLNDVLTIISVHDVLSFINNLLNFQSVPLLGADDRKLHRSAKVLRHDVVTSRSLFATRCIYT